MLPFHVYKGGGAVFALDPGRPRVHDAADQPLVVALAEVVLDIDRRYGELLGRGDGFGKDGVDDILGFVVIAIDGDAPGGDGFVIELCGIFGKGNPVVEAILGLFRSRQVHKN